MAQACLQTSRGWTLVGLHSLLAGIGSGLLTDLQGLDTLEVIFVQLVHLRSNMANAEPDGFGRHPHQREGKARENYVTLVL